MWIKIKFFTKFKTVIFDFGYYVKNVINVIKKNKSIQWYIFIYLHIFYKEHFSYSIVHRSEAKTTENHPVIFKD